MDEGLVMEDVEKLHKGCETQETDLFLNNQADRSSPELSDQQDVSTEHHLLEIVEKKERLLKELYFDLNSTELQEEQTKQKIIQCQREIEQLDQQRQEFVQRAQLLVDYWGETFRQNKRTIENLKNRNKELQAKLQQARDHAEIEWKCSRHEIRRLRNEDWAARKQLEELHQKHQKEKNELLKLAQLWKERFDQMRDLQTIQQQKLNQMREENQNLSDALGMSCAEWPNTANQTCETRVDRVMIENQKQEEVERLTQQSLRAMERMRNAHLTKIEKLTHEHQLQLQNKQEEIKILRKRLADIHTSRVNRAQRSRSSWFGLRNKTKAETIQVFRAAKEFS